MKVVAIIAEYNPFHAGHRYQIEEIRREFGENTAIIAIMSGNFVQRGEVAVADKLTRAKSAVLGGIDLVIELPFPFSVSSAEYFASSAVSLVSSLGVVDVLSFGSESGDLTLLQKAAEITESPAFAENVKSREKHSSSGHVAICDEILREEFSARGIGDFDAFFPNNALAIEYLKALRRQSSPILPHTVKRCGLPYPCDDYKAQDILSAAAIRKAMRENAEFGIGLLPEESKKLYRERLTEGKFPRVTDYLSAAILSFFRMTPADAEPDVFSASGGLYKRLRNASFEANTITALIELAKTKKYTDARIRRAVLCSFFGVTSSEGNEHPAYSQLLAANSVGLSLMKEISSAGAIPVLTKPSKTEALSAVAKRQKEKADRADSVAELCCPSPASGKAPLTLTPAIL